MEMQKDQFESLEKWQDSESKVTDHGDPSPQGDWARLT
jgi:hypothetical protein